MIPRAFGARGMNPLTLLDAFTQTGFLLGLGAGLAASLGAWAHRRSDLWLASIGAAAAIALVLNNRLATLPTPPLALAALAGGVVALGAIGAWWLARDAGPWTVGVCLALTALGVWGTVPDTENALVVLGAASGGALGAWRMATARGSGARWSVALGAALALAAMAFVSLTEGLARPSAPIGALATVGIFALYPLGVRPWRHVPPWALVAVHVALVIACGRVAGQASGAAVAGILALVAFAGGAVALSGFSRWRDQPNRQSP